MVKNIVRALVMSGVIGLLATATQADERPSMTTASTPTGPGENGA